MNYRVKKKIKTKFIHIIHIFYRYNLHNYLNRPWQFFLKTILFKSNSIEFHIFENKAEGKHSRVLKRTCSSLYDFVLFGSGK